MTESTECKSCIPQIDYICLEHRKENQCGGCNKENQKLHVTAFGIICKNCMMENGMVFV